MFEMFDRLLFGGIWVFNFAATLLIVSTAFAGTSGHPCYTDNYKPAVDTARKYGPDVSPWFREHFSLAREISATACGFVSMSKTGTLNEEQILFLRAKLRGSNVPEIIEDVQKDRRLSYYRLFAAAFYELYPNEKPFGLGEAAMGSSKVTSRR